LKRFELFLVGIFLVAVGLTVWTTVSVARRNQMLAGDPEVRRALFQLIEPVGLANCDLRRFGEAHDGGYALCANLLEGAQVAYSYGISGYDGWGCDVSKLLNIKVHQYDCFDSREPACPGGDPVFHSECVAPRTFVDTGRPFDTMENQLAKNGDSTKRLVVKMDVEGAEWDSLLYASEATLERIDQLAMELHNVNDAKFVAVVERLKKWFHVAHLHFNNWSCAPGLEPFPAWAYEVLFVNKRLAVEVRAEPPKRPTTVDSPNNPKRPDCQVPAS
jgi:hypothetical protein